MRSFYTTHNLKQVCIPDAAETVPKQMQGPALGAVGWSCLASNAFHRPAQSPPNRPSARTFELPSFCCARTDSSHS